MKKFYCSYKYVDDLINRYIDAGGDAIQLDEGVLASGAWILYNDSGRKKCFFITEHYLNAWSSNQEVKMYYGWEKFPKKYKKMIEEYENRQSA